MDSSKLPFAQKFVDKALGDAEIEFCNFCPRGKQGSQAWEIKAMNSEGIRKIIVLRDNGSNVTAEEVKLNPFKDKESRNAEIKRLYNDEGLSQKFLANLFGITQPSVSVIIKQK